MTDELEFTGQRRYMVEHHIAKRGLREPRLLAAMEAVPRHCFVPEASRYYSYSDAALPIGFGQTISQPYIVALMTNLLNLRGDERVLEVGTGSGYQAAVLSHMAAEVHTVEFIPELLADAQRIFDELGLDNITCHVSDGSLGWAEAAPYEAILVAAAAPKVPEPLLEQLADRGRMVIPVGRRDLQELEVWHRKGDRFICNRESAVVFVPLRGEHGWKDGV